MRLYFCIFKKILYVFIFWRTFLAERLLEWHIYYLTALKHKLGHSHTSSTLKSYDSLYAHIVNAQELYEFFLNVALEHVLHRTVVPFFEPFKYEHQLRILSPAKTHWARLINKTKGRAYRVSSTFLNGKPRYIYINLPYIRKAFIFRAKWSVQRMQD